MAYGILCASALRTRDATSLFFTFFIVNGDKRVAMGHLLKQIFLIISYLFASTTLSSAFYCDWGQCEAWEYCCKEGVCCTETDPFLLVSLIFVSLVLFIMCGGCVYYGSQYIRVLLSSNKYNIMAPEV